MSFILLVIGSIIMGNSVNSGVGCCKITGIEKNVSIVTILPKGVIGEISP
jgi:hypothetical protein